MNFQFPLELGRKEKKKYRASTVGDWSKILHAGATPPNLGGVLGTVLSGGATGGLLLHSQGSVRSWASDPSNRARVPAIHRSEPHTPLRLDPRACLPAFSGASTRVVRLRGVWRRRDPTAPRPSLPPLPARPAPTVSRATPPPLGLAG